MISSATSFNKNSIILVTGGTGFLGSYIIKLLIEKGYHVRAIRRNNKSANNQLPYWISNEIFASKNAGTLEWVEGDVLDVISLQDAMEGVDTVIHSAAIVSFVKKERKEMYQVNVEGTANVVNMALEKKVHRLVHISSVAALGRTTGGGHVDEEKKWEESNANTHYAKSKYKAELQVWRGISEGLGAVILNPSTILGYGNWNNGSSALFKNMYKGFSWYTTGINGFVDVEDVARATVLLMQSNISEQRFIVNGDTWPFRKLQDTMADHFGKKRPSKKTSPWLMAIAWRVEKIKSIVTGNKPLLTKESARVGQSKTWFENDKILQALPGFSFTPLEETIKKACEKYKASPNPAYPAGRP
jgi:nucleoside-diphosphate-sugar epimerase